MLLLVLAACAQRGYVHDAMDQKYGEPGREALNNWMYGNLMNVKVAPSYSFPQTMHVHITTYSNGKVQKENDMDMFFNAETKIYGIHSVNERRADEKVLVLFDKNQNAMIMLNEKDKTGMAMTMNAFMSKEQQERMKNQHPQGGQTSNDCRKTGRTKMIQGVTCEEYVCVDKERNTRMEAWINTSIKMDMSNMGARGPMAGFNGPQVTGALMEMSSYKNDQLEMKMEVTNYSAKANYAISTAEYRINGH